jgi:hypothetical protein
VRKSAPSAKEVEDFCPEACRLLAEANKFLQDRQLSIAARFSRGITFDEILASNDKTRPESEKLLPGIMTKKGLVKCIRRFYKSQGSPLNPITCRTIGGRGRKQTG